MDKNKGLPFCRRLSVLGTALFISVGLLLIDGWEDAAGAELISYVSNQTDNFDIHIMDTNGKYLGNLTDHPADDFDPTWSPDGRFLGYVSNRDGNPEIYMMDTETKEHRRLTHDPGIDSRPTWSPDGRWIAFVSDRGGSSDIYKMDATGKKIRRLTKIGKKRESCLVTRRSMDRFLFSTRSEVRSLYNDFRGERIETSDTAKVEGACPDIVDCRIHVVSGWQTDCLWNMGTSVFCPWSSSRCTTTSLRKNLHPGFR